VNKNLFIFKHIFLNIQNNKMVFLEKISKEAKVKLNTYIKACLKEEITEKLNSVTEDSLATIKDKAKKIAEKASQEAKALEEKNKKDSGKKENKANNENAEEVEELEEG
jgi:hypothetical protein